MKKRLVKLFEGKAFYRTLVISGLVIWLAETAYFGWNETAKSNPERVFDLVSTVMIIWGIIGDLTHGLRISKNEYLVVETKSSKPKRANKK